MTTPTPDNKTVVRATWEGLFNEGRLELADQYISPQFVNHAVPNAPKGPEAFKRLVQGYRMAFPDAHFQVERLLGEGDEVVMVNTFTGTMHGSFMGYAPTGKRGTQRQIHLIRVANGQIVEHTAVRDDLTLLRELGVLD